MPRRFCFPISGDIGGSEVIFLVKQLPADFLAGVPAGAPRCVWPPPAGTDCMSVTWPPMVIAWPLGDSPVTTRIRSSLEQQPSVAGGVSV